MSFIKKVVKYLIGLVYNLLCSKEIDLQGLFKGKRIAIIGAASSAYKKELGDYINEFDIVVRVNKAPHVLKEGKHNDKIGVKTDVLFHSFFENEKFGGGKLDYELYDELGISFVINPIPNSFGKRNTFNFYKKYLSIWYRGLFLPQTVMHLACIISHRICSYNVFVQSLLKSFKCKPTFFQPSKT